MALTPLAEAFYVGLRELKHSDRRSIHSLSMVAGDHPDEAAQVVSVTEKHLQQCLPADRLSVLHLVDSILRNAAGPYVPLFSAKLPEMFAFVWSEADAKVRAALTKLATFWVGLLPADALAAITRRMQQQLPQLRAASVSVPTTLPSLHLQPAQVLPQFAPPLTLAVPPQPMPSYFGNGNQSLMSGPTYVMPQPLPQPAYMVQSHSQFAAPQPAQLYSYPAPGPQPQYFSQDPHYQRLNMFGQQQQQQQQRQQSLQQPPPPPVFGRADPRLAAISPMSAMLPRGSTPPLPSYGANSLYAGLEFGEQSHPVMSQPQTNDVMSPVLMLGGRLAAGLAQPSDNIGAGDPRQYVVQGQQPPPPQPPPQQQLPQQQQQLQQPQQPQQVQAAPAARPTRSTEFTAHAIKEFDPSAVSDLLTASESTRGRFMDLAFHRSRRLRSSAGASRQWYVASERWLTGTTSAPADEAPALFEEDNGAAIPVEPPRFFVQEDPSQPECAISGERFERTYDPDADEWYYEDAVMLTGDEAASYGVMDGSIVKVQCLAGGPSSSQAAQRHLSSISQAEAHEAAADLMATAAAAPAESNAALPLPTSGGAAPRALTPGVESTASAAVVSPSAHAAAMDQPGLGDRKRARGEEVTTSSLTSEVAVEGRSTAKRHVPDAALSAVAEAVKVKQEAAPEASAGPAGPLPLPALAFTTLGKGMSPEGIPGLQSIVGAADKAPGGGDMLDLQQLLLKQEQLLAAVVPAGGHA